MMRSRWLRLLATILAALGANGWAGTAEAGGRVLYERDFAHNTALAAGVDDVVLLELERGSPKRWEENRWRHRLDAGTYSFCLEPNDPLLAQVVLEDRSGRALLRLGRGRPPRAGHPECATLSLPSGLYQVRALHDSSGISGPSRLGFVRVVAKSPPLVKNGTPVGGFWALQPDAGPGRIALPSSWSRTGDLFDALAKHTATLLPDRRVLVAGGLDGSNDVTGFAQLYDPVTAQWTPTGTMTTERLLHTATLLASGMVLVAGGWAGNVLASAELYDPRSGQWTASGSMRTGRIQFTATLLPSGRVLVAGGSTSFTRSAPVASAELYEPATGLWAPTGAMNVARSNHTATVLSSGQVLVVGGDATGTIAELYDPATGTWTPTGSLQTARSFHAAALLSSGKVLVTGGLAPSSNTMLQSAELYDPTTGQWSLTGAMSEGRALHTATRLASGQVLVAGGSSTEDGITPPLASAEQYDPASQSWAPTGPLRTPRGQHTATLLSSGDVLVAGGFVHLFPNATTELFPATRPLIADSASTSIDAGALFSFADPTQPLAFLHGGRSLDLHKIDSNGFWTLFAHVDDTPPVQTFFQQTSPLFVTDLGYYRAELGVRRADGSAAKVFVDGSSVPAGTLELNYDFIRNDPASPMAAQILFRFFPDGTQVGELSEGEVAIFQQCNYQGKAAVFAVDTPSLAALTSALVTLDKTAASIRLGNNTGVVLYTEAGYSGTSQTVEVDTPCLEGTPIGTSTTSLQVRPLAPTLLVSSRSCENCQLVGVDLSGLDLSGVDLRGANLDGATAPSTVFSGATLTRASLRSANLATAELYGAQLSQADLEGANLGGAFLTNNETAGIKAAASLVGAHLKNVNLSGAQLSGADFTTASFYGSTAAGTGNCTVAQSGFTQACATAAGATMNNTQFGNAYLYGVDFTNSNVQGVQFGGAVLIGANFSGAKLSVDPTVGTNTGFQEAFLQGTNLADADLTGTSLFNAFLDFRDGGNTMVLLLNEKFAGFPNWHAPNQPICIILAYGSGTSVPTGNTTLICPDGAPAGASGCGATNAQNRRWASSLGIAGDDPAGSYFSDATYTPAGPPVCAKLDTAW